MRDDNEGFEPFRLPGPGILIWSLVLWATIVYLIWLAFHF